MMSASYTAFQGNRLVASGALAHVALAAKAADERWPAESILVFDDQTGKVVDLDLRGSEAEIAARFSDGGAAADQSSAESSEIAHRGRGRPKLGVVAREVTLLPRQWDWLATQPGGASQALRRLVDEARRAEGDEPRRRAAREAAYRFMSAIAGDLPGFEETSRALFAGDRQRFRAHASGWPADIRDHAERLASAGFAIF